MIERPVPLLRGEETIYFDAARDERLVYQTCTTCGHRQFYPRTVCTSCLGDDLAVSEARGTGTVYSYTTVMRPAGPEFAGATPYTVVLVDLSEGVRVIADLADVEPDAVRVGMAVRVFFEKGQNGFTVPRFEAAGNASEGVA